MKPTEIICTPRVPTIAEIPLAIGTILKRNQTRDERPSIFSRMCRVYPVRVIHRAKLSEGLVESNFPVGGRNGGK